MNTELGGRKRQYGRKKLPEGMALDQSIKLWVTKAEKEEIEKLAGIAGVSASQYCRGKVADTVPLYRANPREVIQTINKLSAVINPIGNNINQLARHANIAVKNDAIPKFVFDEMNKHLGEFIGNQKIIADAFAKFLLSKK